MSVPNTYHDGTRMRRVPDLVRIVNNGSFLTARVLRFHVYRRTWKFIGSASGTTLADLRVAFRRDVAFDSDLGRQPGPDSYGANGVKT